LSQAKQHSSPEPYRFSSPGVFALPKRPARTVAVPFRCSEIRRGEDGVLADDETLAGLDEQDPAAMERLMKHMGNEMGENFGNEMAETIDSSDENRSDLDESDGM